MKSDNNIKNDIRYRDWMLLSSPAAEVLTTLLKAEDSLMILDDFQQRTGQRYPDIEDLMIAVGSLREKYTNYIEKHPELLSITEEKNKVGDNNERKKNR